MKRLFRWVMVLAAIGTVGWGITSPAIKYWKERSRIVYRESEVTRGRIVAVVNSTGTIKPVRSVLIGSFVSGPIKEIFVDFNHEVKAGDRMAQIDPLIYKANVARDAATLATRKADVERVKAQLQQAINDEARSKALRAENRLFISDAEMDQFRYKRESLAAELGVAQASVDQAQANLDSSQANLNYTRSEEHTSELQSLRH